MFRKTRVARGRQAERLLWKTKGTADRRKKKAEPSSEVEFNFLALTDIPVRV